MSQQLPIIERAEAHGDAVAISAGSERHTYRDLLAGSAAVAGRLLDGRRDLDEARVAVVVPAGGPHVAALWGVWRAGGVAVPLGLAATQAELEYALGDCGAACVVTTSALADRLRAAAAASGTTVVAVEELLGGGLAADADPGLPPIDPGRRAFMLYTSGTTSKPKGVVHTHATIRAQIESLVDAWRWRANDRIPLFLPLHHVHAAVNIQACGLWSGATIEAFPAFDTDVILDRVAADAYTLFMAVPTIYVKLIEVIGTLPEERRRAVVAGFGRMRLMVSGSAGLPASVHATWEALTGQRLLERYGMTEIGMALSNPYDGERRAGFVGVPLPGVEVRLVAEQGGVIAAEGTPGEIQVRGPAVFREYWNAPDVTARSFTAGWFRTGDVAVVEGGSYRILGRSSVDIIKSGGYKLSALEIEAALLDHPDVAECAVVGLPDETWGEVVAAAVVPRGTAALDAAALGAWAKGRMSPYKTPRRWLVVGKLPRNALGKVTKPAVREFFTAEG
jgi:malonyl-CoA/methylmalonyl-CoA synthetase